MRDTRMSPMSTTQKIQLLVRAHDITPAAAAALLTVLSPRSVKRIIQRDQQNHDA